MTSKHAQALTSLVGNQPRFRRLGQAGTAAILWRAGPRYGCPAAVVAMVVRVGRTSCGSGPGNQVSLGQFQDLKS